MPYLYNGKIIREGRSWTDDAGVKHPTNWASWSDAEKAAKGLVWQDPPPPPPPPTPEELLQRARAAAEMDRFAFATAAATAGYLSWDEAAQWAAGNAIPAAVQAVIDALPAEEQGPVTIDVLARPVIRRAASLMDAVAAAFGATPEEMDALFGIGAQQA
jgi:hypothetical protein